MLMFRLYIIGIKYLLLLCIFMTGLVVLAPSKNSYAADCCTTCNVLTALCSVPGCACQSTIEVSTNDIPHVTEELRIHQEWFITVLWDSVILPSMMRMTQEITTTAYEQVHIIGTFLMQNIN